MKITTGGLDVLDTATFLATGLGETVITIDSDPDDPLRLVLDFVDGADGGKLGIEATTEDKGTLRITLNNWSNPLGTTLPEPALVGVHQKRQLFMLFSVHKLGDAGQIRAVTLSLYRGEKV